MASTHHHGDTGTAEPRVELALSVGEALKPTTGTDLYDILAAQTISIVMDITYIFLTCELDDMFLVWRVLDKVSEACM